MLFDLCRPHLLTLAAALQLPPRHAPRVHPPRARAGPQQLQAPRQERDQCGGHFIRTPKRGTERETRLMVCVEKATLLDPRGARQPGAGALKHDAPHGARCRGRPGRSSSTPRLRKAAAGRGKGGISAQLLADEATTSDTNMNNKLVGPFSENRENARHCGGCAGARGDWTYPRRAAGRPRPCLRRRRGRRTRPSVDLPSSFLA